MNRIKLNYSHFNWLPKALIHDAITKEWVNSLAYFLILKSKHHNGIFYNFNYRKLSEQTGLSTAVLNRHIKKLIALKLATIRDNNLCLTGINKLKELYKSESLVPVKWADTKQETIANIQFTRIVNNLNHQHKIVNTKIEIIKLQKTSSSNPKTTKSLLKQRNRIYGNATPTEKSISNYYSLSNEKFGSLNNRSKSTGYNIQKKLNKLGLIKSEPNYKLVSHTQYNRRAFYELCLPSKFKLSSAKGYIYEVHPNKITLGCNSTYQ